MLRFRRKITRSQKAREKRRRARVRKFTIFFMVVFVLFFIPFSLSRLDYLLVKEISVQGNESVLKTSIKSTVENDLTGNLWGLYPRSNIVVLSTNKIKKNLQEKYPKLDEVNVSRENLTKLSISVSEREPFALWCSEFSLEDCIFLDRTGFAYEKAPVFSSSIFLKFNFSQGEKPVLANHIIPEDLFLKILSVKDFIEEKSLNVETITFGDPDDVSFIVKGGGRIIFEISDLDNAISNLDSVFSDESLDLKSSDGLLVEYIDLRFGNKVFYKRGDN